VSLAVCEYHEYFGLVFLDAWSLRCDDAGAGNDKKLASLGQEVQGSANLA
jgi:hypothetical protein